MNKIFQKIYSQHNKIIDCFTPSQENTIKNIIIVIVTIAIFAMIGYFGWLNHRQFQDAILEQVKQQLLIIAKSEAQSIEKYISDINKTLERLPAKYGIRSIFAGGKDITYNEKYHLLLNDAYDDIKELIDGIYIVNSKGIVIDRVPFREGIIGQDFSKRPDVSIVLDKHESYTSGVLQTLTGQQAIAHANPVYMRDRFIGMVRVIILIDRINKLVSHINEEGKRFVILLDKNGNLLSYPDNKLLGIDLLNYLNEKYSGYDLTSIRNIIKKMNLGEEGTGIFQYPYNESELKMNKALIGYCPINIINDEWSIAVAMDYKIISGLLSKNIKNNLIFIVFIFLVVFVLISANYRAQKKKAELAISVAAVNIINKQLHLEISEREKMVEEFKKNMGKI